MAGPERKPGRCSPSRRKRNHHERGRCVLGGFSATERAPQAGRRPAIVAQDAAATSRLPTILLIPMTTQLAALRFPGTVPVDADAENGLQRASVALVFQRTVLDQRLIQSRLGRISDAVLQAVWAALDELTGRGGMSGSACREPLTPPGAPRACRASRRGRTRASGCVMAAELAHHHAHAPGLETLLIILSLHEAMSGKIDAHLGKSTSCVGKNTRSPMSVVQFRLGGRLVILGDTRFP